jgi:hypothetical protein
MKNFTDCLAATARAAALAVRPDRNPSADPIAASAVELACFQRCSFLDLNSK